MTKACAPFRNPLCVALDVDTQEQALDLARALGDQAGGFKLGPRLIHRYGEKIVRDIAKFAPVFVDCKFFDIPSTMTAAVQATFDSGASFCTVHALAGREALTELAKLEDNLNKVRPFRILAVTILTSWSEQSFAANFKSQSLETHVEQLADLVKSAGLRSVVCSPNEVVLLKGKGLFMLTPGIRLPSNKKDDQSRVLGPREAIANGSSALVVGRPIIAAADPRKAAQEFLDLISGN